MSEEYTLILNSQSTTSNLISNANLYACIYNINWQDFLPQKYQKYACKFTFQSIPATILPANALVGQININFGKTNVFDGQSMITTIGAIYPTYLSGNILTYNGNTNNNNEFTLTYPTNNQITVNLNTLTPATALANIPNYNLILTFRPIELKDLSKATPDTQLQWKVKN